MAMLRAKIVQWRLVGIVGVIALIAVLGGWLLQGKTPQVINSTLFGVAIKGYDPVAYFTDGRAIPGKAAFEYTWRGAKWRFASAEHRGLFVAQPTRYTPQYGGF